MQYLPLRAQVIYLRGIRRYADKNGIAGVKRSISWKSLSEVAEVRPERGSTDPLETPSRKAIRVSIAQLERAGLVEQLPQSERFKGLVFKCLLAVKGKSAQMRKGQRGAMMPQRNEGPRQTLEIPKDYETAGAKEGPREIVQELANEGPASPSPSELPKGSSNTCASTSRFTEFWSAYPVKKGKAEAEHKWKVKKLDAIADQILTDVKNRQQNDRRWIEGYIPYGSTYVNKEVWRDDIEHTPTQDQHHEENQRTYRSAISENERAIQEHRARKSRDANIIEGQFTKLRG